MTDSQRADDAFESHDGFEHVDDGYAVTTTPFDGVVRLSSVDDAVTARVTITVPTLDAVVEGESVGPAVEDGWFETFELRLSDPEQVTEGNDAIDAQIARGAGTVTVEFEFTDGRPDRAAENAKALVEFVEGTWMQGVIPGYEYGEPAASLIEQATRNYDEGTGPSGP